MEFRYVFAVVYLGIVYIVTPFVTQWSKLMLWNVVVTIAMLLLVASDLPWFYYIFHLIILIQILWEKAAEKKVSAPTPPANAAPVEKPSARRVSRPIARLSAKHVEVVA
jgi:thiol:disulfide interchange protein